MVAASHATHATFVLARTFAGSRQLGVTRSFPVTWPLAQIVEGLNEFQPTDLFSYTLMLRRLAQEMQLGRLCVSPSYLNCAGEPLTAETRAEIEDTFRCPLSNHAATTGTPFGPQIDHMIGRLDYVQVVLDHDDGVALLDEFVEHVEELPGVLEVEARRGFIQYV